MGKKLASYVHVLNEETGQTHVFGPDDDLPDWAAKKITNKAAFVNPDDAADEPQVPSPGTSTAPLTEEERAAHATKGRPDLAKEAKEAAENAEGAYKGKEYGDLKGIASGRSLTFPGNVSRKDLVQLLLDDDAAKAGTNGGGGS